MRKMIGGCLCGQVRYAAEAEPSFTGVCHCHNCQREAGSAFSVFVAVPTSSIAVSGTLKTFHGKGDSGQPVTRKFCPDCGSSIISEAALVPDTTFIKAGSLDDTQWLTPTMEIYCDSLQPWVGLSGGMQRFPRMPQ